MAPSQLSQLKAALNTSGLSRQSKSKKTQNAKGRAGLTAKDREKKQKKLEQIKDTLNRFDVREEKVKNPVVGKVQKSKAGGGLPSQSRQKGLEMRRETLLPELQSRRAGHTGTFVDRRFGEANPSITPEERALERFTRTREASGRTGKKSVFNLNDEDAGGLGFGDDDGDMHLGSSSAGFTLTHGGRSIDSLKGDDFAMQGLDEEEDLDDDFGINREVEGEEGAVERRDRRVHFGGGSEDGEEGNAENEPERKRSKAEIMAEVVAKSKSYKYERQQQKELDEDLRMELDEGLDDLRELLAASAPKKAKTNIEYYKSAETAPSKTTTAPTAEAPVTTKLAAPQPEQMDYDQHVRALAFDRRAKPKDRTKTEEEMVKEEAERLQEAEQARLKRMRGEEDDEEVPSKRRRREKDRAPEGDDLEDDLDYEDDNEAKEFGLGEGIGGPGMVNLGPDSEADEESEEEEGSEAEGDDIDEDGKEGEEGDTEGESELDDLASDLEEDISAEEDDAYGEIATGPANPTKIGNKPAASATTKSELPFTFPCPEDYEQFLDLIEGLEIADVETVVKRIRTLHHPSLAEGNKERLQGFLGILLDHVLAASPSYDSFALVSVLSPHISSLVALNPLTAAECFKEILAEMHDTFDENLKRPLTKSSNSSWPDLGELAILRLIGLLWSTSDFSHPVSAPATLYMGHQLSIGRIKSLSDIAAGLFLVSLFLQYEAISKKIVPEALNFLAITILSLAPSSLDLDPVPGSFPLGQVLKTSTTQLQSKVAKDMDINKPDLVELLQGNAAIGEDAEQAKLDLIGLALDLVGRYAEYHEDSAAFIELFQPFFEIVFSLSTAPKVPASVKTTCKALSANLGKLLSASGKSRKPLSMQSHRPIPIATFTPKFDAEFNRGKRVDPDSERNEAAKLKAQYKKERKGAIRELRKDARFIAGERVKEQKQKDQDYEKRMRSVVGSIATTERAEEKAAEREKARDKRRAGRK